MIINTSNFNYNFPANDRNTWVNGSLVNNDFQTPSDFIVANALKRVIVNNQFNIFSFAEETEGLNLYKEIDGDNTYYFHPKSIIINNKFTIPDKTGMEIQVSKNTTALGNNGTNILAIQAVYLCKILIIVPNTNEQLGNTQCSISASALQTFLYKFPAEELLVNWPANVNGNSEAETIKLRKKYWPSIKIDGEINNKSSLISNLTGKAVREVTFSYLAAFDIRSKPF